MGWSEFLEEKIEGLLVLYNEVDLDGHFLALGLHQTHPEVALLDMVENEGDLRTEERREDGLIEESHRPRKHHEAYFTLTYGGSSAHVYH